MNMKYLLLFLVFTQTLMADVIYVKYGQPARGRIKGATEKFVRLGQAGTVLEFEKVRIDSIHFEWSDKVFLDPTIPGKFKSITYLYCKVAAKCDSGLIVVSSAGIDTIPHRAVSGIAYNQEEPITAGSLPATDLKFYNEPSAAIGDEAFHPHPFLTLHLGLVDAPREWNEDEKYSSSNKSETALGTYGLEAGYTLTKVIQLGIGYEAHGPAKGDRRGYLNGHYIECTDQISSAFLYGALKIGFPIISQQSYYYVRLDFGSFTGTERLEINGGGSAENSDSIFGYRIGIGTYRQITRVVALEADFSYRTSNATVIRQNFSTLQISIGLGLHFIPPAD